MGIIKVLGGVILWVLKLIFSIIGGIFGIGGGTGGPRPSLPPSQLPVSFRGVWVGMLRDTSPNTYDQYRCVIDLENWKVQYDPTGPGHHGAAGDLRLVQVEPGFVEIEEDIQRGHSIDYAVDGIFRLKTKSPSGISVEWRSQYPDRDIYVGRGELTRVLAPVP